MQIHALQSMLDKISTSWSDGGVFGDGGTGDDGVCGVVNTVCKSCSTCLVEEQINHQRIIII